MPTLTDSVSVGFAKGKEHQYECPSAMKLFNTYKKDGAFGFATCKDMADAIVKNIDPKNDAIDKITMSMMGGGGKKAIAPEKAMWFLNLHLKDQFLADNITNIFQSEKITIPELQVEPKSKDPFEEYKGSPSDSHEESL